MIPSNLELCNPQDNDETFSVKHGDTDEEF